MDYDQEQAIKTRGYQLWQEGGASHGHDREDWERAEHEMRAAEQAHSGVSVETSGDQHSDSIGSLPYDPAALFCTLAQNWIDSGKILASLTPWSFWSTWVR